MNGVNPNYLAALFLISIIGCTQRDDLTDNIDLHRVILFSKIPLDYRFLQPAAGGKCNFERVTKELNGDYSVVGWAIPSVDAKFVAKTYLISVDSNKSIRFGVTRKQERSDVADHFDNKQLLDVGFLARFKKSDLQSGACISIYQIYNRTMLKCNTNLYIKEDGIEPCP